MLTAMVDLYARDPTKQWYMFVDDDSYIFLNNALSILSQFNSSRKVVVGHFYCAWPDVVFGRNHNMQCMNFPQGGAGVAISRGLLKFLGERLGECNQKYNSRLYAGSMRFGKCVADFVTDGTWRYGDGIQNYKSQFMSRNPILEIEDAFCNRPPATFHNLRPRQLRFVFRGHFSAWTRNGSEWSVDWSHLTCRPFLLFPEESQQLHLRFGYGISLPNNRVIAAATTAIIPTFEGDEVVEYEQGFGESVKVNIICDDTIAWNDVEQDYVENRDCLKFVVRVRCPGPRERRTGSRYEFDLRDSYS
jgi:hypothetical protein